MSNAQDIADQLNAIEQAADEPGQNSTEIWAYVQTLPEYDEARIDEVDPSGASDRVPLKDGSLVRWDDQRKVWYAQS